MNIAGETPPTANASAPGGPNATNTASKNEQETIEADNDNKVDNLRGYVGQMKHLALDIGQEVHDQNSMLEDMDGSFGGVGDSVRKTIALVQRLGASGGGLHLCALFCFAFVFFTLVYLLLR